MFGYGLHVSLSRAVQDGLTACALDSQSSCLPMKYWFFTTLAATGASQDEQIGGS